MFAKLVIFLSSITVHVIYAMKKHILSFILISSSIFLFRPAVAQDYLVDYTYLGSRTKIRLVPILFIVVDYDIDLYKIRYKTLDVNMQPDTASGLLVLPQVPASTRLPMVLYAHGTTSGPEDVPSNLQGGYEIAMGYAGFGFATVAPDYLGLGDARGFHPYLHAETESSASRDMIFAGREFLEMNDPDLNPELLFLSGYSQGGHTSMALHRELEQSWSSSLPVTAATHMSGPYSMSGAMRDRVLSDQPYNFPSYIAYIFLGYNEAYDLYSDIHEVFKEPYATSIISFYNEMINLSELNGQLLNQLAQTGGPVVKRMLQDSILSAIENDLSHQLNIALMDNDTYEWAPEAPTRLLYCGMDSQVPPINSLVADSVMNVLGADDVEAVNINASFDHGACVFPAVLNSKNFFQTFVDELAVDQFQPGVNDFAIHPNPAKEEIIISWESAADGVEYKIVNTNGDIIRSGISLTKKVALTDIPAGIYMIICSSGSESRTARIFHP